MTDSTTDLARTVARLLERRLPDLVADLGSDEQRRRVDTALVTELGLGDLLLAEADGGAGGTLGDAAVVARELGRRCAPSTFLTSTVLAGPLLAAVGAARPGTVACLAVPWDTPPGPVEPRVTTDGRVADGEVRTIAGLNDAEVLVVPARLGDDVVLLVVDPSGPGVDLTAVTSFDVTRPMTDLRLTGAPATVVARGAAATDAVTAALLAARAVLASEQVGVAEWCLATTVDHLSTRRQFGRTLGSFQALKHRLAQAWIAVDGASAVADRAAAAGDDERAVLVAVAQSECSEVAVDVAEECLQLHGGIGMTWEHPLHAYLKRAVVDRSALGAPDQHRQALAGLVDLPA